MRRRLFCLAGLALAAPPVAADELLLLKSGLTLVVSAWRFEGPDILLMLPGDGLVVVDQSILVEARLASGPESVVTWRREPEAAVQRAGADRPPGPNAAATPDPGGGAPRDAVRRNTPASARPRPVEARSEGAAPPRGRAR